MIWLAILLLTSFVPHKLFGTLQIKELLFFFECSEKFLFLYEIFQIDWNNKHVK